MIKTIRWLAIVVAALVALVAVALVFFSFSPGEKILKGILESRLSAFLEQPVTIGNLETNVISRLVLQDIRVSDLETDSEKSALAVHDLRVDYRLWPLLHKDLTVNDITIDSLGVNLYCDSTGKYNLVLLNDTTASSDTAAASPSSFSISLGSVRLENFSVAYDDAAIPAAVDIRNGRILLTPVAGGGHAFDLAIGPVGAEYDSVSILTTAFSANGYYADTVLRIDSALAQGENMVLAASGEVPLDSARAMSGRVDLTGRPDSLLDRICNRFGLPKIALRADFAMTADIGGAVDDPEISAVLDIPGCDISGARLNRGVVAAQWRGDSIRVDSLYLDGFGGMVYGTAEAVLDSIPRTKAELILADINISDLWEYFYHESSPYAGRLQGTLSIAGEGNDITGWSVDASLRATRATYKSQPFPDFSAMINFSGGSGRIRIDQDDFTITATGKYDDGRIDGSYSFDVQRLEPLAEFFDLHELSGSVSASGNFDGTIDNPSLTADIEGSGIRYENFPVDSVTGSVALRDSILTIKRLRFEGDMTVIDPEHPPFHVDSIAGEYSYRGQISGTLDSLNGSVSAHIYRARYREYAFDSAGASAQIAGRETTIDSAWAFRGSDYLSADGRYDIDRGCCMISHNRRGRTHRGNPMRHHALQIRLSDRCRRRLICRIPPR